MATEREITAGAKAIALNCASVNCLRYVCDETCAMNEGCSCRQEAKLAIEAPEKVRNEGEVK